MIILNDPLFSNPERMFLNNSLTISIGRVNAEIRIFLLKIYNKLSLFAVTFHGL